MRNPSPTPTTSKNKRNSNTLNNNIGKDRSINTPCCNKVGLKRGPWTPEEDQILANYINKEGEGRWRTLPKRAGLLRCGKSCRLRWMNYLRPSVKRGHIAPDEEDLILRLHRLLGNRWSLIAGRIPGRTDNEIKNYWNTHLSKKLISQGIDPRTHKPLNPPSINIVPSSSPSTIPPPPIIITENHHHDLTNIVHHHHQPSVSNPYDYHNPAPVAAAATDDVSAMGFVDNEDCSNSDVNINYYSEDVLSSFLNSLINDDAFAHHVQAEIPTDRSLDPLPCDHDRVDAHPLLGSIATASAPHGYDDELGVLWESPLLSATFNQHINDHITKRVHDHHHNQ